MSICYLNGGFLPLEEARIAVLDRGFLFGDAVYEVIPAFRGQLFAFEEHIARLARSLDAVDMRNPHSIDVWRGLIETLLQRNGECAAIYLQISRGVAPVRDHVFTDDLEPTVFAMVTPPRVRDESPVAALLLEDIRWLRCDIKSTALHANVMLRATARRDGAYDAILHRAGSITEGAATNVFAVLDGDIVTPPTSNLLLRGVTRDLLIQALGIGGLMVSERDVKVEELRSADEIWLTSSSRNVALVGTLDGKLVAGTGEFALGNQARALFDAFKQHKLD